MLASPRLPQFCPPLFPPQVHRGEEFRTVFPGGHEFLPNDLFDLFGLAFNFRQQCISLGKSPLHFL